MALIMVADDEPDIVALFTSVLSSAGHTVHTASDGSTALARIAELRPDLTVLDHYMPELTGLQVAQQLRADPATSSLPLLMLSAAAPPTALLYCNVVLAKPVTLSHFSTVVHELLRPAPAGDPLRDLDRVRAVGGLLDAYTPHTGDLLDRLTAELAADTGAGMAAVGLVLVDAVAVCGAYGLGGWIAEAGGMPAEWAPCTRVVRGGAGTVIDDLRADPDLAGTPLTTVNGVRAYAGVPLADGAGRRIGAVSVMSREPGVFTPETLARLAAGSADAAKIVMG